MNTASPSEPMQQLIDQSLEALAQLRQLLDEESDRLKTRRIEGLEALLAQKAECLQRLERIEQARRVLVRAAGFGPDADGMRGFLARQADPRLAQDWQTLTAQLKSVQQLNETNGLVIQRSLDQVERNLRVLHGQPATVDGYGPKGNRPQGSRGREISRA